MDIEILSSEDLRKLKQIDIDKNIQKTKIKLSIYIIIILQNKKILIIKYHLFICKKYQKEK